MRMVSAMDAGSVALERFRGHAVGDAPPPSVFRALPYPVLIDTTPAEDRTLYSTREKNVAASSQTTTATVADMMQ